MFDPIGNWSMEQPQNCNCSSCRPWAKLRPLPRPKWS